MGFKIIYCYTGFTCNNNNNNNNNDNNNNNNNNSNNNNYLRDNDLEESLQ